MRPMFSLHPGEYLVAAVIEKTFKNAQVWVPLRDSGVDLLVSDPANHKTVSLQVKFSKDFLVTHMGPMFQSGLRACGWWTINRAKLAASPADYWVFVLQGFASRSTDYVVVPRRVLFETLSAIHGAGKIIQVYLWATARKRCWETRGLNRAEQLLILNGGYRHAHRDLTQWLNNWDPVAQLNTLPRSRARR